MYSGFSVNGREFPWRNTTDPYQVIVAEMLLQQTDAAKAKTVFELFVQQYPSPECLAEAEPQHVVSLIQPIGLSYRAPRLQRLARKVVDDGFPAEERDLMALPGVGRYVARATMCFAFGRNVGVVDTNVVRVLDRVFGLKPSKSRPHTDRGIWEFADSLVPEKSSREYNYAVLDLAALVCRPSQPLCTVCPVTECVWRERE
ncbi:MAG: hypothetical protein M1305_03385 [Candidatus Marsarchaeota archaeon]|nr:hypothetical protein [Candidatus Marsarchaeota archaeon]